MLYARNNLKGFTLIEVLVVFAIISIISAMSILSWQSFSDSVALGNSAKMIETKIKLAKNYSLSALNDTSYGVYLKSDSVTIFPGIAYIDGNPLNQVFTLTDGVEIYDGVGNSILFSRLTGVTADFGTIGVRIINRPTKVKTISINAQGQTGTDSFETSSVSPISNARHVHFDLGWDIRNITALHLAWEDNMTGTPIISTDINNAATYFNVGQTVFDWSGITFVNSVSQPIRIHSWLVGGNSVLCVMRDQTENEKLKISFTDGITKEIGTYTINDVTGEVSVTTGAYGGTIDIQ